MCSYQFKGARTLQESLEQVHSKSKGSSDFFNNLRMEPVMAKPLDPKEIVTVEELAISNMLEIEALRQLLFEKGIITEKDPSKYVS